MDFQAFNFLLDDDEEMWFLIFCMDFFRSKTNDIFEHRLQEGSYEILVNRHLMDNDTLFMNYFRLSPYLFQKILEIIRNDIENIGRKKSRITAEQKLCVALRFLISGNSQSSMKFDTRISQERISQILKEVFFVISKNLRKLMPIPKEIDWKKHAQNFFEKWNFPNAIGAIDGKHIRIQCPSNSGSLYFNYKGFFSVVLLAIVDADYKYIAIDVGSFGRESDGGMKQSFKLEFRSNKANSIQLLL